MNDFMFVPKYSIEPGRMVDFNQVIKRKSATDVALDPTSKQFRDKIPRQSLYSQNRITRKFHDFQISANASKNLKRKINWMYYLAKAKTLETYSGTQIYNFKIGFLTLTLPSKQKHPTNFITKNLFNQFLTEIRSRTEMINYVWRLEFQNNGNVHYHLVTDCYLDYFFVLKIWNRILDNYGYIDPYKNRFKNLSLREYNKLVNPSGTTEFPIIAKRFAKGCQADWSQPNSIDIKVVTSHKNIRNYIAKYFSKKEKTGTRCNSLDNSENSFGLRLWYCSQSLSKLKTVTGYVEELSGKVSDVIRFATKKKTIVMRYAKLFYFDLQDFQHDARRIIEETLRNYAFGQGYSPV